MSTSNVERPKCSVLVLAAARILGGMMYLDGNGKRVESVGRVAAA